MYSSDERFQVQGPLRAAQVTDFSFLAFESTEDVSITLEEQHNKRKAAL